VFAIAGVILITFWIPFAVFGYINKGFEYLSDKLWEWYEKD
jgi:hypothetical protein